MDTPTHRLSAGDGKCYKCTIETLRLTIPRFTENLDLFTSHVD
jgi:hypothetical protein